MAEETVAVTQVQLDNSPDEAKTQPEKQMGDTGALGTLTTPALPQFGWTS